MPLLSSLPSLSQKALAYFSSQSIYTVEAFLACDVQSLPGIDREERSQAVAELLSFVETLHGGIHFGDSFLQQSGNYFLPTGCVSLDSMLQGGLLKGAVTEVVGASASGKTQLCLQTAATVAYQTMASVAYIDTSNSFSAKRIAHMLGGALGSRKKIRDAEDELECAMRNIVVYRIYSIFSLFEFIQELEAVPVQATEEHPTLSLLILDSASSLISPILGGRSQQGHPLMIKLGFMLKRIAHAQNFAILFTNHTVSGDDGQTKPALGESWKSVPHARLLLERDDTTSICRATVLKHSSVVSNKQAMFHLSRAGFKTVDGITALRASAKSSPQEEQDSPPVQHVGRN